jgi:biogenesis of lysosome-related organelles complex 1 subunit 2
MSNSIENQSNELPKTKEELDQTGSIVSTETGSILSLAGSLDNAKKNNEMMENLSKQMIETAGSYIKSEIDICIADYNTLEKMNKTVTERYNGLNSSSANIINEMNKLNEAYSSLAPLLKQVDDVELCIGELEVSANKLDVYSKKLEARYRQFMDKQHSMANK